MPDARKIWCAALERMKEGRLVIDVCDMPIKCPVAPIEFAFLADYYFTKKGVRDAIDITLVTPYAGAKSIRAFDGRTLKSRLPNAPLLPSHMNFVGKDLETTPHARHAMN